MKHEQSFSFFSLLPIPNHALALPLSFFLSLSLPLLSFLTHPYPASPDSLTLATSPGLFLLTPSVPQDPFLLSLPSSGLSLTKERDAGIGVAQLIGGHTGVVPIVVL